MGDSTTPMGLAVTGDVDGLALLAQTDLSK
jgi:hypothetical protein